MHINWEPLEIEHSEEEDTQPIVSTEGLQAPPELLQKEFLLSARHLDEVRAAHSNLEHMVGRIPNRTLDASEKYIDAAIVVSELGGRRSSEGLTIPLQGVSFGHVRLECAEIKQGNWVIRLNIDVPEQDSQLFTRTFSLPEGSNRPSAEWFCNNLRITH